MIYSSAHRILSSMRLPAREAGSSESTPTIQSRDLGVAAIALALGVASWTVAEAKWPVVARRMAMRRISQRGALAAGELATIRAIVGDRSRNWIEQTFWPDWLSHKYHGWMQILACHWPRRWQPRSKLVGGEHIDAALARGRGAILWSAAFAYKDLMAKVALAQAGYRPSHLCRDTHGFSESRLGKRWLNPVYTRVEARFVGERMVFSEDRTKEVNMRMKAGLRGNKPVIVTTTPLGRRVSVKPFLHGRIRIATGSFNFACELDSPVLPVFTIRQPGGEVITIVEPALATPTDRPRSATIEAMLDDYVPRLETYVAQYPEQFCFPVSDRDGAAFIEPLAA